MKKILLGAFLLISSVNALAFDAHFRLGAITNSSSYNKESGSFENYAPTFGVEVTQSFALADLGVGIAYNKSIEDVEVETIPVYGLAKFNFFPILPIQPYVVGKLGTTLYSDDDYRGKDATTYYGAGVGMYFLNMEAELLYSRTKVEDDDLNQVSFVVGFSIF